jgi:hypothetical protein
MFASALLLAGPRTQIAPEERQRAGFVGGRELLQEHRRNRRESTRTGRKKPGRHETHRSLSSEMPPPGTIMCTAGDAFFAEPQVLAALLPQRLPRERFSGVLGMFSSSEVKVLYPT